ncbi:hypothetical protein [Sphingomonas mali]|uniref:hypothetical protein n=1 Tax=Sphingomonas mali TaxID=40682 RepID=UPI00082E9060|nr:hypothetical protein [Sphingomonas mali]
MHRLIPLAAAALALAACGEHDGNSTSISFSGNSSGGAVSGGIDSSGNLKINANGFKADLKLPKFSVDANNFEMNGVHLYPGSTISSINVNGGQDEDKDPGKVRVAFTSPANAATVRDWLKERLGKAGFALSADGAGLTGKTDDGKPFALKLSDQGANKSSGTIDMGG